MLTLTHRCTPIIYTRILAPGIIPRHGLTRFDISPRPLPSRSRFCSETPKPVSNSDTEFDWPWMDLIMARKNKIIDRVNDQVQKRNLRPVLAIPIRGAIHCVSFVFILISTVVTVVAGFYLVVLLLFLSYLGIMLPMRILDYFSSGK